MNTLSAIICCGMLALASPGFAQCNSDATGPCDQEHSGPGCIITECCDAVCSADPICCELDWDEFCTSLEEEVCGGLSCPGAQPCDQTSDIAGCSDPTCCRTTCDHDWYCCYIEWDQFCVGLASEICDRAPCELEVPGGAFLEDESCDERINDGCNLLEPAFSTIGCGELVLGTTTTSTPRDTDWYQLTTEGPTQLSLSLESEFPAQALLFGGPCEGPFEVFLLFESILCESPTTRDVEVPAGTWSIIVSPGREELSLRQGLQCPLDELDPDEEPQPVYFGDRYLLSVECVPAPCAGNPDLNGDGRVDGADLTLVLAGWGSDDTLADIDCSGIVDGADLTRLLADWTG